MLLTGASGFVGSHILDSLCQSKVDTAVLLRNSADTRFLEQNLAATEVRRGSITEPATLANALKGVTHVVHCAGLTKAVKRSEFYEVNHLGSRNLVEAVNSRAPGLERFLQISSLAVSGPASLQDPASEESTPSPVSDYGKSKLAGEQEVVQRLRTPFTILRPPAVYGPRDSGFFSMFKAVNNHLLPRPNRDQALSLVYAKDLADAVVVCLTRPEAAGQTYFVASPQPVTSRGLAQKIAQQMGRWTVPCPIPAPILWVVCLWQEIRARVTREPSLLNLQKFVELRAPGWVCKPSKLSRDIGFTCKTPLEEGIAQTLDWYIGQGWL